MEFFFSVLSGIFIAIVIATALTFGIMILVWTMVAAFALALGFYLRQIFARWWFLHQNEGPPRNDSPTIIDGEYKDLTD